MSSYLDQHREVIRQKNIKRAEEDAKRAMRRPCESDMARLPVRSATPEQYAAWVRGYLGVGGEITHHYDYDMPDSFKLALASFDLPNACGALSIEVIVPAGILVKQNGHCNVFNMGDFTARGGWVPMYDDVARLI